MTRSPDESPEAALLQSAEQPPWPGMRNVIDNVFAAFKAAAPRILSAAEAFQRVPDAILGLHYDGQRELALKRWLDSDTAERQDRVEHELASSLIPKPTPAQSTKRSVVSPFHQSWDPYL
jgi:hypothetical protein